MNIVVILNENPDKNINTKISNNREYTRSELKSILSVNLSDYFNVVFYDNFEGFKTNYTSHLNDYVLNFDFGYKPRIRNMCVPAFCENYNIRYFNPDPYAQILCQDKYMTKKYAENFGIKTPNSILVYAHSYYKDLLHCLKFPIIIKPNYESESIGITQKSIVSTVNHADCIINQMLNVFDGILLEEYIDGNEIAISIFENNGTIFLEEVELILPDKNKFKYKAYTSEIKQHIGINIKKSCFLNKTDIRSIKQLYHSLSPNKLIRIDGRIRESEFYLIEINANPGLYPKSIVPRTFEINGYTYKDMIKKIFVNTLLNQQ